MSLPNVPRFLYLTGCDGTGKTTQADLLCAHLQRLGARVRRVWLRFPFLFSLPLLAYARWRRLSWHEEVEGARHGYWDFRTSRVLKTLLPWTLLLDAALAAVVKIYIPLGLGRVIVCERFVLDILVDMAVAFDDASLFERWPGRLFMSLLPHRAAVVMLDLDAPTIWARRADLRSDRHLEARLTIFRRLADAHSLPVVSSAASTLEVNGEVLQIMTTPPASKSKFYAVSKSRLLRSLLGSPIVALGIHWVFQGMLYMDRTERLFKLGLDLLLGGILFAVLIVWTDLTWLWSILLALGLAHTMNFLVNGQVWVVLKHFGLVRHARQEFEAYMAGLQVRLQSESSIRYAVVYGSRVRGEWNPASDLDVRLVRESGWLNAMHACAMVLRERTRATVRRFPLDIYLLDNDAGLRKLRMDEPPLILINREGFT